MYLIDTNVISEQRKGLRANAGVQRFFATLANENGRGFLSVVTVGELRRGVERIRQRGDREQAERLAVWLNFVLDGYRDRLLDFGVDEAQLWGRLRVPNPENALDKQIAATALLYDLTLVTRNTADFLRTGVRLLNPFT